MSTIDFSMLKPVRTLTILLATVVPAFANEPPPPESFTQRGELILTLSDDSLSTSDGHRSSQVRRDRNREMTQVTEGKNDNRPVNLGCGMDVSPFGNDGNSLSNRLVGECNLQYRY